MFSSSEVHVSTLLLVRWPEGSRQGGAWEAVVFSSEHTQSCLHLITTHCNTEDICVGHSVGAVSSFYLPYLFSFNEYYNNTQITVQRVLYIILCPPLFHIELIGKASSKFIDDQLVDVWATKFCCSRPKCLSPVGNLPVSKIIRPVLGLLYCIQFSEAAAYWCLIYIHSIDNY